MCGMGVSSTIEVLAVWVQWFYVGWDMMSDKKWNGNIMDKEIYGGGCVLIMAQGRNSVGDVDVGID